MDAGASDMQPATDDDGNVVGFKVLWGGGALGRWAGEHRFVRCWRCAARIARLCNAKQPPICPVLFCAFLKLCSHCTSHAPQVLTAVEDYGAVSSSLAEQGLKIQPEASGLVYVPMVQQVGPFWLRTHCELDQVLKGSSSGMCLQVTSHDSNLGWTNPRPVSSGHQPCGLVHFYRMGTFHNQPT